MEFEKIRAIISDQLSISEDKITLETSFREDLGADSLDLYQVISELEEEYNMEFTNDAADKIKTVGDAVEYIRKFAGE
ncbi:MAG: acyl carrier protein [Defluviitaleaceae bacterium]|nr:acyl carrier protein [Defluviitaleaceae bacterium]